MAEPGFELALWVQVQLMTLNYDILLISTMLGCQHVSLGCWNGRTNGLDVFKKTKNDAFELWCWRRLLRVPWTARRSNQSILKEISAKYSLKGLVLKLKLQFFGHLMWRADSLEKTFMLGKIEGRRRRGWQRMGWLMASLTQWTWVWTNSGIWWWTGKPVVL